MSWGKIWEAHRIRISQIGVLALIWIAHPRSVILYNLGFLLALMGQALRLWSAGHIRKGEVLACAGPYALLRHPLYLGSGLMSCGFALISTSLSHWISSLIIWGTILSAFFWLYAEKIRLEDKDLAMRFGREFEAYAAQVPALWPNFNRLSEALHSSAFSLSIAIKNKEYQTLSGFLALAIFLRFKMIYHL
jgi:protein-S-isoprenylcysteine O-methyltransferase Ste14